MSKQILKISLCLACLAAPALCVGQDTASPSLDAKHDLILRGAPDSIRVLVDNKVIARYQPLLDELRESENVRMYGYMTLDPSKLRVFNVEKVERRETDAAIYRGRIDRAREDALRTSCFAPRRECHSRSAFSAGCGRKFAFFSVSAALMPLPS